MNKYLKDRILVYICCLAILLTVFSAFSIITPAQVWENSYGRLEVYPDTSREIIRQRQWWNVTSYFPSQNLDIAFRFDEVLSYGGVYYWNGTSYNKLSVDHVEYNSKHWYILNDIYFKEDSYRTGYWEYDVPINSSGKWHLYAKRSIDSIQEALDSGFFIHLDPWWSSEYNFRRDLYVNSSYIDADLVDFTVLWVSTNSTFIGQLDDGNSLRFISSDNTTEYPYEIEYIDSNELYVWINISNSIDNSVNTHFNCYWNNSGASAPSYSNVWNSDYVGVYHLGDASGGAVDSSIHSNDLSESGSLEFQESGRVKYGVITDAVAEYLYKDDPSDFQQQYFTAEIFFKYLDSITGGQALHILHMYQDGANPRGFNSVMDNGSLRFFWRDSGSTIKYLWSDDVTDENYWYYWVAISSASGMSSYVNDTLQSDTDVNDDGWSGANPMRIGEDGEDVSNSAGYIMDEFRFSKVVRNSSWIKASYHTIDKSDFIIDSDIYYTAPCINETILSDFSIANQSTSVDFSPFLNWSVNISSVCGGSISFANITCSNGNSTSFADIGNQTIFLNISASYLNSSTNYTVWVNTSIGGTANLSSFWFITSEISFDELSYEVLLLIYDDMLKEDSSMEISLGINIIGLLTLMFFFIYGIKEKMFVMLVFATIVALALGLYYVMLEASVISVTFWLGIIFILWAVFDSFLALYYGVKYGGGIR